MEKRNYYYLVAGLPDLVMEQSKIPFSSPEFIETLREMLHPDDFHLVRWLLYPADHQNILGLLQRGADSWNPSGQFSHEELEAGIREPHHLPAYMAEFYQSWRSETPIWAKMSWENQLTRLYYETALRQTDGFLNHWLQFDLHLRNILAAWNIREFQLPTDGQILGENEITAAIGKSAAQDFGLSRELPFLDRLLYTLEQEDLLEREKAIDRLKWNYIDELNTFNYFTIEVILGYLLKLMMLERWLQLEPARGKTAIDRLIQELENSFALPEKYT